MHLGTTSETISRFIIPPGASCPHMSSSSTNSVAVIALSGSNLSVVQQALKLYSHTNIAESCAFESDMTAGSAEAILRSHAAALIIDTTCNGTAEGTFSIVDLGTLMERDPLFQLKSLHAKFIADELRFLTKQYTKRSPIIFVGIEMPDEIENRNKLNLLTDLAMLVSRLSGLIASVVKSLTRAKKSSKPYPAKSMDSAHE